MTTTEQKIRNEMILKRAEKQGAVVKKVNNKQIVYVLKDKPLKVSGECSCYVN